MTTHAEPVRLGIIGAGIMGERLLGAALEHARGSVTVTSVWDPSAPALARIGGRFPEVARTGSADAVIEGADCIYIASPPGTHLDHAGAALSAGRAVFCEKPLATDPDAAVAFVRRWQDARFAVNFPFASSFAVQRLREWIAEGAVGAPRGFAIEVAFARWPRPWQQAAAGWLDGRAEGGFTREVVSHFLFLSRRLLGMPLTLGTHGVEYPESGRSERRVEARLTAGGVPGTLVGGVGTTGKDDHNTWTLEGVGAIRLRDWSIAEKQAPDGTWHPDPQALPNEKIRPLVLKRQLEGVAAMTRGEPHHLATLSEALEVQQIVESLLAPAQKD